MPRNAKYDVLFEPVVIGPKVLKNRFVQTAHCMGGGSERPGLQSAFRATKAEGGWAAVSTEYCSISPESDDIDRVSARLWDDDDVANLAVMCDAVHAHDALAAVELWHGGATAKCLESRLAPLAPSQTGALSGQWAAGVKEMDRDDIRRVIREYACAAARAQEAGFDILTLHSAHTAALPHHFLVPLLNRRSDEYGGSFENRARFAREVLEAIREATGGECAIAVRFGIDTLDAPHGYGDKGIRASGDGARFLEHCDDIVDVWDLTIGTLSEWAEDVAPSRTHRENHEKPFVIGARDHTSKPIITVGRFTNPDTMVEVIRSGQADIIGAARPSIADPFLPSKIEEGRLDEIRECIGCNVCIGRWELGGPALICTQNATAGEEYRRGWHPERFERAANADNDVLIVGAGPAGMECAVVLAKRGMRRVHLVDAAAEPGGSMRWIPRLPGLGEWARVIDYRRIQIDKLKNVEFIGRTQLRAEDILEYGAEIVVLATGASWNGAGMNGVTLEEVAGADASAPHVLTPDQLMLEGKRPLPGPVLVYDCDGYFVGPGMAELLAREGREVTYVTPFDSLAPFTHYTGEQARLNRDLRKLGIGIVCGHVVNEIDGQSARGESTWREGPQVTWPTANVVLVTQREPAEALYLELSADRAALAEAGITGLYRIGDCAAPRLPAEAIFDGHRLAREIDSDNPSVARPFLRERPDAASVGARAARL